MLLLLPLPLRRQIWNVVGQWSSTTR